MDPHINTNHRIVWNKARGAFVIVGENARKHGKCKAVACATAIALSALVASPAVAAPDIVEDVGRKLEGVTKPQVNEEAISAEAIAEGDSGRALAVGVLVDGPGRSGGEIGADVTNNAAISAYAEGETWAKAVGVQAEELDDDATFTNNGTVEATVAGNRWNSSAYAVRLEELDGSIVNNGLIRAIGETSDRNLFAIYAEEGKGSVTNEAGAVIDGRVVLGEDDKRHGGRHHHHRDSIDLTNHGLLDIRSSDSFVSGDFVQSAGGMLKIEIADHKRHLHYGNLEVNGDATLENGTQLRVKGLPGQLEAENRLHSVIRADSFVTDDLDATLASLRITDNILAVNFTAQSPEQCGRDEVLDLVAYNTGISTIVDAIKQYGLSSAEDLAGVLDQLILDPDGRGELTEFLYQLGTSASPEELANKVAQALPLVNGASARASLAAIGSANRIVQSRLEGVSGRSSGDAFAEDRHVWIKPFGTWTDQDKTSGAPGYDAETAGVVVGIDGLVTDNSRLGVALSYSDTNVDSNTNPVRQRTDITSYQLALYGSYSIDESTDFNYIVGAGRHDNDSKRTVLGTVADASFDGSSFFAGMGVAHTYVLTEQTSLTPSVRLDYAKITLDSYTEDGGFGSQHVEEERTEELVLGVDGKITHKLNDKATFVGNLGVGYDLINDRNDATASFVGGSNLVFTAKAGETDPWRVRAGLGIVGRVTETVELTARYDIEGRDGYTNQTASLKLRKSF